MTLGQWHFYYYLMKQYGIDAAIDYYLDVMKRQEIGNDK